MGEANASILSDRCKNVKNIIQYFKNTFFCTFMGKQQQHIISFFSLSQFPFSKNICSLQTINTKYMLINRNTILAENSKIKVHFSFYMSETSSAINAIENTTIQKHFLFPHCSFLTFNSCLVLDLIMIRSSSANPT